MDRGQALDLAVFLLSVVTFLGYNAWVLLLRPGYPLLFRRRVLSLYKRNYEARGAWAASVCENGTDPGQTYVVQNLRNGITAATFLASACSLVAVQGLLPNILDVDRVARIDTLARADPLSLDGSLWMHATGKLVMMEVLLFFAFLCFAQSIRLWVSLAYYAKVVTDPHYNKGGAFLSSEAVALNLRASSLFTLAFRAFFAFVPLFFWIFGPLALLLSTLFVVGFLYVSDTVPVLRHPPQRLDTPAQSLQEAEGRGGGGLHGGESALPAGAGERERDLELGRMLPPGERSGDTSEGSLLRLPRKVG